MKLYPVNCSVCRRLTSRSKGRMNESRKLGWKIYCSKECEGESRRTTKLLFCSLEGCEKSFWRKEKAISRWNFCSSSCAAKVNNRKHPKRQAPSRVCSGRNCAKQYKGPSSSRFCSRKCKT